MNHFFIKKLDGSLMQCGFLCLWYKICLGLYLYFSLTVINTWWHCFREVLSKHKKMEITSMISVSVVEMRVNWATDPHAIFFSQLRLGVVLVLAISILGSDPGNNMYHPDTWRWLNSCWITDGITYMRKKSLVSVCFKKT